MTGIPSPPIIFQGYTSAGVVNAFGFVYTYAAGTTTPIATYTDSTLTTPNTNPVQLNAIGQAQIWLTPGTAYKYVETDAFGNQCGYADQLNGPALTQAIIGALLYPQTAAELAAGVTPTNYAYPPGNVLRYGNNTAPGTTDMTAAFAALALTGYVGYAPAQDYLISSAIAWTKNNSGLTGDGLATRILTNNATAHLFTVGTGSTPLWGARFENFRMWSTVQKTAGDCFHCAQLENPSFQNVHAGSLFDYAAGGNVALLWNGYTVNQFSVVDILAGEVAGCANVGVQMNGTNSSTAFGAEFNLDSGLYITNCGTGVRLTGGAGGVYLGRVSISLCTTYGLHIDVSSTSTTYPNREVFISDDATIDTSTNHNVYVEADSVAYLEVAGCSIAGSISGCGVYAAAFSAGTVPGFKFTGTEIYSNASDGLQINDGSLVIAGGCRIFANGANGVNLPTQNATPLLISGNNISNNTGYGVLASNASQTNSLIEDNMLTANNSGGAQMSIAASLGNAFIVRNNVGFVTENAGSAAIPNSGTSVAVNHGLAGAPSFVSAILPTGQLDAGAYFYVNPASFTSTQFTVTYSTTAGAARGFLWRATMGTQ